MVSSQKLLNALYEIKEITGLEWGLFHANGKLCVSTYKNMEILEEHVCIFVDEDAEYKLIDSYQLFKIYIEQDVEYVLVTTADAPYGIDKSTILQSTVMLGKMAVCQIRNIILSQTEQNDRNSFFQNVLLGNLLTVDLYGRAKKLHIEAKERVTFVIDTASKQTDLVMEFVKNMSDLKAGDFVTSVDENSVVLIKDVSMLEGDKESVLAEIALGLVDNLHMEAMVKVRVGYGTIVNQLPDIAQSFQEAKMALQVGKVFYAEHDTISYSRLGIGRLIYQLPMSLCEMFIKEVFGDTIPDILDDEEAMSTISKFFENNLNISETARQLYVHRNTLVYRLERIEKAIGLDIRSFDDAMTFRIAIMVLAHMKEQKQS